MLRARFTRADRLSVAILVALPILLNLPFALAGRPVLDGDNLTQNYPLRVYVGELMRHGRLPLWDAGIWSGVPLLAGWNAGAMFPGTWIFAFLPGIVAYELDIIATGVVCGVGFLLFLRRQGCSPLASFLGALTFSEMGFVSGQQCHLGLIEGTAMLPLMLLAIDGIWRGARAPRDGEMGGQSPDRLRPGFRNLLKSSGHWVALLGLAGGLTVLAGDPRAVSSNAIAAGVFLGACCWRSRPATLAILGAAVSGAVLAVAIGAAQWLPGLSYLHGTQRAAGGVAAFGFGSLGLGSLPLLVTPYLLGGNGNFSMPNYLGPLNTPEVTFAVGILPVVALFALAPRLWRREARIGVWYILFGLGIVLTAGTKTPLGNVLAHVPLYGGQRLQNRNALLCDLALSVLLAVFVDVLRPAGAVALRRLERFAGSVPPLAVLGLVAAMFVWRRQMERFLGATRFAPHLPVGMTPYYVVVCVIALAALGVLWWPALSSPDTRRRVATGVVLADVALFVAMASYQPVPTATLSGGNSPLASLASKLAAGERYAIDDPNQLALSYPQFLTDDLGVNDLNLLHGLASAQGYGSAVPAAYETATGTHEVENLLPAAFLGAVYDELNLGLVVAVPDQFGRIVGRGAAPPVPAGPPVPLGTAGAYRQPGALARYNYPPAGPWRLAAGGAPTTWQLPAPTDVSDVVVRFESRYGAIPGHVTVSVGLAGGGRYAETVAVEGSAATLLLPPTVLASGGGVLTVSVGAAGLGGTGQGGSGVPSGAATTSAGNQAVASSGGVVASVTVTAEASSAPLMLHQPSTGEVRYVLDGVLQGLLAPPDWVYAGRIGPLVLYRNERARGAAWLEAPASSSASGARAAGSVTSLDLPAWKDPVDLVDAPSSVLLVRSEQFAPGWSVSIRPAGSGGPAVTKPVVRVGLLQGVELGPGRYVVTWHYSSHRAELGLVLSAAGCLGCLLIGLLGLRARRRQLAST